MQPVSLAVEISAYWKPREILPSNVVGIVRKAQEEVKLFDT